MEDQNINTGHVNSNSGVSFPSVSQPQPQKKSSAKTLLVLGILILVLVLGFIIFKNGSNEETEELTPTPYSNFIEDDNSVSDSTPEPTSTPKAVDKSDVKINIQNGTGVAGEAAYLQTQLKTLGYSNMTAGNASSQDETTTTVTFAKSLDQTVVDEITKKLKDIYQDVSVKTSSTATTDVVVVTGTRKGATSKASATPSASPKPTSTSSN